ncbi:MAG: hypothetical protein KJ018_14745 [Burkholderiales bacterium]|nr:hypothetical protein [Burkholderiales bacterium]
MVAMTWLEFGRVLIVGLCIGVVVAIMVVGFVSLIAGSVADERRYRAAQAHHAKAKADDDAAQQALTTARAELRQQAAQAQADRLHGLQHGRRAS